MSPGLAPPLQMKALPESVLGAADEEPMNPPDKERLLASFSCNPPADPYSIRRCGAGSGIRRPDNHTQFLQEVNGGERSIGDAYLILWRAGELPELNSAYQVSEYVPGLFLFSSNGGGKAFAFDTRSAATHSVSVPFVGMELRFRASWLQISGFFRKSYSTHEDQEVSGASDILKTRPLDCAGMGIFESSLT